MRLKLLVLDLSNHLGVTKPARGTIWIVSKKQIVYRHPCKTPPEAVGKVLAIRTEYQFGALRIMYYLDHYHGIKIAKSYRNPRAIGL
jgi:hypothetical protein